MQSLRVQSFKLLQASVQRSTAAKTIFVRAFNSEKIPVFDRPPTESEDWGVFPRQREGRIYTVNWSLNDDNISPRGENAFHNARLPIILGRLGTKLSNVEAVDVKQPILDGPAVKFLEAGDSISQNDFNELAVQVQAELSSGVDLFVEDNIVGSHQQHQLGVRVITDDPATALIARSFFFPSPPREVDHRARMKGWNFDPRWIEENHEWNGKEFVEVTEARPGQRPIVVFHTKSDKTAVQFIEYNGEITGANIILSKSAPANTLTHVVGYAASVILNEGTALAISGASFVKGNKSLVVVNADEEVTQAAVGAGADVYGKEYNVITADSLSTLFRGSVGNKPSSFAQHKYYGVPAVVVGDKSTLLHVPDNQTFPTNRIVIVDKTAASSSKLSAEDALKAVLKYSESNKEVFVKSLLEKIEVHQINNAKDITKFLA